jgi:hypothetical protein
MATQNPYSNSLLMDAFRGSLSNAESLGRGFAVAPVGLLGDINALARQYVTPRLPQGVQSLLQSAPAAPTTEQILSNIPRVSNPRMETAGMEQLGAAMNPRGPVDLARGVGRVAGNAINEAMVYDRGLLAGITPQPMRAVQQTEKGLFNTFDESTKYHQKVPEVKNINIANLKRMNSGEVADVSDEVAAKMDFSKPIQVSVFSDGEMRIVDGHHRVAAAKKLGMTSLPVELQAINAKGKTLNKLTQESVYPQQAAFDLAQQRAALPVEQGGLGLLSNNTAAERAAAMGFDTDVLHGTAKDFPKFDMNMAGVNTRQSGDELGIFSTSKPFLANNYAEIASKGGWANRTQPEGAVVYPLKANLQSPKRFDTATGFYREADPRAANQSLGDWRNELQSQGYDSVIVRPDLEEVVAFNPDQLRSRFAAFDPFRKTAATAAAMGVAAPDLLAQEQPVITQQQIDDEMAMYGLLGR